MTVSEDRFERRYGLGGEGADPARVKILEQHPVLSQFLDRRTQRQYTQQPVDPQLLDTLLDVAFAAPSKSDYQQASVIRVDAPEKRREIAALVPAMPWIGTAPVLLVFCADARRLERICALRGKPKANRNLEAFFNASIDAALVLQTFMLAAGQVGLGCCAISAIRNHLEAMAGILSLPEAVIPVAGLTVGYPGSPGFVSMRLPPAVTRSVDAYDDRRLAAELEAYDRRREQRYPTPREKQRDVATFGYSASYGWSEDKARQANGGEGAGFGRMVRACGFTLD